MKKMLSGLMFDTRPIGKPSKAFILATS